MKTKVHLGIITCVLVANGLLTPNLVHATTIRPQDLPPGYKEEHGCLNPKDFIEDPTLRGRNGERLITAGGEEFCYSKDGVDSFQSLFGGTFQLNPEMLSEFNESMMRRSLNRAFQEARRKFGGLGSLLRWKVEDMNDLPQIGDACAGIAFSSKIPLVGISIKGNFIIFRQGRVLALIFHAYEGGERPDFNSINVAQLLHERITDR